MGIIDKVDNFHLLRRKKALSDRVCLNNGVSISKSKTCMPSSEKMKEMYTATVTHLKSK